MPITTPTIRIPTATATPIVPTFISLLKPCTKCSAYPKIVLLQSFRWVTRSLLESKSSETISTLLDELTKYKILVKKDGLCMPVYAMNKMQKALFEAVNLTEEQVENAVRALKIEDHIFCRV